MIGECSIVRTAGSMAETNNSRGVPRHVWSAVAQHSFGLRRSCFFVGDASNAECRLSAQKSEAASSGRIPSILVMSTHGSASWLAGESGSRLPQSRVLRTVIRNQLQLATLGLGTMLGHLHRRSVGQQVWISRSGHELIVFGMASNPDPLNPVRRIDTDGPSVQTVSHRPKFLDTFEMQRRMARRCNASNLPSLSLGELFSRRSNDLLKLSGIEVCLNLLIPVFVLELMKPLSELRERVLRKVANTRFNFFNVAHWTHRELSGDLIVYATEGCISVDAGDLSIVGRQPKLTT